MLSKNFLKSFSKVDYQRIFPSARRIMNEQGIDISKVSDAKVITKEKIMGFMKEKVLVQTRKPSISFPHRGHKVKNIIHEDVKQQETPKIEVKSGVIVQENMHTLISFDNMIEDLHIDITKLNEENTIKKLESFILKACYVSLDKVGLKLNHNQIK